MGLKSSSRQFLQNQSNDLSFESLLNFLIFIKQHFRCVQRTHVLQEIDCSVSLTSFRHIVHNSLPIMSFGAILGSSFKNFLFSLVLSLFGSETKILFGIDVGVGFSMAWISSSDAELSSICDFSLVEELVLEIW